MKLKVNKIYKAAFNKYYRPYQQEIDFKTLLEEALAKSDFKELEDLNDNIYNYDKALREYLNNLNNDDLSGGELK